MELGRFRRSRREPDDGIGIFRPAKLSAPVMGNLLLEEIPIADLTALKASSRSFSFGAGDVVHDEGQAFENFIFIDRGVVAALLRTPEGGDGPEWVQLGAA